MICATDPLPTRRALLAGGVATTLGLFSAARPASAASAPVAAVPLLPASPSSGVVLQAAASALPLMLGASGDGVLSGAYEQALGRSLDLTATWADSDWSCVHLPLLRDGGVLVGWDRSLDVAVGAFGAGTTWEQAAAGACDERWTTSLQALASLRAPASGTTYLRFAHEMNGNWYPWSVTPATVGAFKVAWARYRALQLQHFPAARLVFCLNHNTVGFDADSATLFPGPGQVDVLGVGYYNRYPYLATAEAFAAHLPARDGWGGPTGLEAFRQLAEGFGVPLCIPEWSLVADETGGDSPEFVAGLHDWLLLHAGAGVGQVLYACQFNVSTDHEGTFNLLVDTQLPQASEEYRRRFGR